MRSLHDNNGGVAPLCHWPLDVVSSQVVTVGRQMQAVSIDMNITALGNRG